MFKNLSITDLADIALLLEEEESRTRESNSQRKRKKWVHTSLYKVKQREYFLRYIKN
jgi:hypothetical protein